MKTFVMLAPCIYVMCQLAFVLVVRHFWPDYAFSVCFGLLGGALFREALRGVSPR